MLLQSRLWLLLAITVLQYFHELYIGTYIEKRLQ